MWILRSNMITCYGVSILIDFWTVSDVGTILEFLFCIFSTASAITKAVLSICNKYMRLAESEKNSPLSTCTCRCEPMFTSSFDFAVLYNSLQPGCWKQLPLWKQRSEFSTRSSERVLKPGVRAGSCFTKTQCVTTKAWSFFCSAWLS